jgi:Gpi18-like mannosyltransferase
MTNTDLGLEASPRQERNKSRDGLIFVIAMWFLSRSVIAIGMQLIAPFLYHHSLLYQSQESTPFVAGFIPKSGWELFSHWDGEWYTKIATLGYSYADDGEQHSVAFYPLFPLLIRGFMVLGMRSDVAGVLINSLAFLGALVLIYFWVEQRYDTDIAKWTNAVLAWCPFSLFCSVMYTEGLFFLLTASALRYFERGEYIWAAVWGALTTATRGPGVALIPTFLLTAWREKRPPLAYAAGFASALGLLSFSLYCDLRFGDALAFVHVQKGWVHPSWLDVLSQALKLKISAISRIVMVFGSVYLFWFFRNRLTSIILNLWHCCLIWELCDPSTDTLTLFCPCQ